MSNHPFCTGHGPQQHPLHQWDRWRVAPCYCTIQWHHCAVTVALPATWLTLAILAQSFLSKEICEHWSLFFINSFYIIYKLNNSCLHGLKFCILSFIFLIEQYMSLVSLLSTRTQARIYDFAAHWHMIGSPPPPQHNQPQLHQFTNINDNLTHLRI